MASHPTSSLTAEDRVTATFEPTSLEAILLALFPKLETSDGHQHISANSLKMAFRCPEQFRRRYVLGHKAPPNSNMLWGGADHRAVGFNYEQKISTEKDLPVKEVQDKFAAELDAGIERAEEEIDWGKALADKTPEQARAHILDRGANLVGMYQETVAPALFPVSVEEEFNVIIEDGLPMVKGFIDLKATRAQDTFGMMAAHERGDSFVVERKTKSTNKAPEGEDLFQARLYELASGLPVEFQVSVKTAAPKVVLYEPQPLEPAQRTLESVKRAVLGIATCYALYGPEQPWPDNGRLHTWACGFCGFKTSCPYWVESAWPK